MDDCQLSGSLPMALSGMTSLTVLSLNSNQFSGSIPAAWASLNLLVSLSVATPTSGGVTGAIPSFLSSFTSLGYARRRRIAVGNQSRVLFKKPDKWLKRWYLGVAWIWLLLAADCWMYLETI